MVGGRVIRSLAACVALAACGGLAGSPSTGPDTSTAADASVTEGGGASDAAGDAATDDAEAGLAQRPHEVLCGAEVCLPSTNQECCLNGTTATCIPTMADPPCSYVTTCDEAADCTAQRCVLAVGKTQAACSASSLEQDDVVLCGSDSDCVGVGTGAERCTQSSCAIFPYKTCGGACPQL